MECIPSGRLSSLCFDLQTTILSYLSTHEYGILRQVSREMTTNPAVHCTLQSYRLNGVISYERLTTRLSIQFIRELYVECKNCTVPYADKICMPRLEKIQFYASYSLYTIFFDWGRFFEQVECPSLRELEWQNVPFPFEDMTAVLIRYGIGKRLRRVKIPPEFIRYIEHPDVYAKGFLKFYEACPNLEGLTLDMETKSMDASYVSLFRPVSRFVHLRELQLINRSKTLIDQICEDVGCLPQLEVLAIQWIYDSNPLFPIVDTGNSTLSMPLTIRKPCLHTLRITYHEWHRTSLGMSSSCSNPMVCFLTLETSVGSVRGDFQHVLVRVIRTTCPIIHE